MFLTVLIYFVCMVWFISFHGKVLFEDMLIAFLLGTTASSLTGPIVCKVDKLFLEIR